MNHKSKGKFMSQWQLQAMIWPSIILMILFAYIPMFGIIIVFQNYSPLDGFTGSEFVGFQNFQAFLGDKDFYNVLFNTLGISLVKLLVGFPAEIILALLINELRVGMFKKFAQTISYLPHFLSWVILGGMVISWLSAAGLVNNILMSLHIVSEPIEFLSNPNNYWGIATLSDIWKEVGWGTILYLAAMSGIDPTLYEAAKVDGAGKIRRIWHITLPGISQIVVLMLVLRVSGVLGSNFEQGLVLQNSLNMPRSEVLDLFVYHLGLGNGDFSYAAAIGLFTSVVSVILLLLANLATRKINKASIF
ncbi:ABC transporter permease subunit [Neobacillus drentensis]|uniref:ABC transporter permease n=1 Tax=Neobacillus drentensis TaxID=220684 RepID=UPI002FFE1F9C